MDQSDVRYIMELVKEEMVEHEKRIRNKNDEAPPRFSIETQTEQEHRNFLNGPAALAAIWDLGDHFRRKTKYDCEPPKDWEEVRELFWQCCGDVLKEYEG